MFFRRKMKFDPYDPRNLMVAFPSLDRSYEASKRQFWNDTKVLDDLIERHGRVTLPEAQREALRKLFSIIYYGEIVALQISAELIPLVEDLDAQKVLATQVVEEAKHVTAFQRYLTLLGGEIPPVNFFCKQVLEGVRATRSPALKLLGMQLLVENLAHHLFLEIRSHVDEPVLRDLLRYIDQDEAKHVGLARNYLPHVLARAGKFETAKILGYSLFWGVCLLSAGYQLKEEAHRLDIDVAKGFRRVTREHRKLVNNLGWFWRICTRITLSDAFIEWLADTLYVEGGAPPSGRDASPFSKEEGTP